MAISVLNESSIKRPLSISAVVTEQSLNGFEERSLAIKEHPFCLPYQEKTERQRNVLRAA